MLYDFISGSVYMISTEMKLNFCQNGRSEITPAMSFILGCIM